MNRSDSVYRKRQQDRERQEKLRKLRKQWGLCRDCGSDEKITDNFCPLCAEKARRNSTKRRQRKRQEGICYRCTNVAKPGRIFCAICMAKESVRHRARYEKLISRSLCTDCGSEKGEGDDTVECMNCKNKHLERRRSLAKEAMDILGGKCAECGSKTRLTIDHVFNDGNSCRFGRKTAVLRRMIVKGEYQRGRLQALCDRCNTRKPHTQARRYVYAELFIKEAMKENPKTTLADVLRNASEKCEDPDVAEWFRRLAAGDSADNTVSVPQSE